ncbi:hypothetical protein FSP39_002576 [Pinctada imbricata]|uniref:BLOC-1 subunit 6 n=1 Tax=Pinctada imbricata TaxID=66713 RepID=A0AA89BSY9_PINIB|nr:hypothetical protein FSP39_002576 [Pinctada imbricata]
MSTDNQSEHQQDGKKDEGITPVERKDEETPETITEVPNSAKSEKDLEGTENTDIVEAENEELPEIDPAILERLSFGLLEKCLPSLQKAKSVLDDVLQNQGILIDSVQQENSKFDECKAMNELNETMIQAKKYHSKLVTLKKEMNNLTDKSFKLKKRALKLQQQKQKEELQRVHQQDRDQERERALEARVAKPQTSQPT